MERNEKLIRKDFSKISGSLDLPNLVEVQTASFQEFTTKGIEEVFKDIFPIVSSNGNFELQYVRSEFKNPEYGIEECKNRNKDYCRRLYATLSLQNKLTGAITSDVVFLGDYPWMSESGTFVIKGVERVIVSQLVRSPGAYYAKGRDKTGSFLYNCDIIPGRGTWLQFESDAKKVIWVRIDRTKKVLATSFFRALGITSKEEFKRLFGNNQYIQESLEKDSNWVRASAKDLIESGYREIYEKLRSGEPYTFEGGKSTLYSKFFDDRKYDLAKAGRYKLNKKLGIYDRLVGLEIAEDLNIFDEKTGECKYPAGTLLEEKDVQYLKDIKYFENNHKEELDYLNTDIDEKHNTINSLLVYTDETHKSKIRLIGTDLSTDVLCLTIPDIIAAFSYYMTFMSNIGKADDIDHLSNRRIKTVGELLQNQFRVGLTRMEKSIRDKMSITNTQEISTRQGDLIKQFTNTHPLTSAIREFFSSSQLSQFMDQTNPLAELTNKRRLSALGPGGLSRDRAGMEVRDVHFSHYGRICPIETPEGPNIGLINNLCSYAKVNEYGFLQTPYRKVNKETQEITDEAVYLDAAEEFDKYIAQANIAVKEVNGKKIIADEHVIARFRGEPVLVRKEEIDFVDVSPKQIVSVAAACIPFLENDDGKRALMGANMQRQAIPLLKPHSPYVGTGMEERIAHDSGLAVIAEEDGIVTYVDCKRINVANKNGEDHQYNLSKFVRSNQGTSINQTAIVKVGEKVKKNQVIADGPAMDNGELALGQNVTVAFMTWDGYNFEDAVIMSERMVKDDVYTSIHIEEYDVDCRDTKLGAEEITRDLNYVGEEAKQFLDEDGIIVPGAKVKEGDILVGKLTPKGVTEPTPEEKVLRAIFGEKVSDGKDTSLRVPHGGEGIVLDVKILSRENGDELLPGIIKSVKVFVAQKRKISEGDKMAGRHGNKGVISRIVPVEDMPYLADGTPIDIMLNPIGVPSRMNIGQVLELHLGMAAQKLGFKVATPVFDGVTNEELIKMMKEANIDSDGKTTLYDGRTGEPFDERISVGVMYMIKLAHMVDDKLHARATGPYSLVTQQPLGGKAQNGGQRFGEMEVWALEAYGAAHTLQEILTIKSDDMVGRQLTYKSILDGKLIPDAGIPESFRVLQKELQGLAINVRVKDSEGNVVDMQQVARETELKQREFGQQAEQKDSYQSTYSGFEQEEEIVYDQFENNSDDYE